MCVSATLGLCPSTLRLQRSCHLPCGGKNNLHNANNDSSSPGHLCPGSKYGNVETFSISIWDKYCLNSLHISACTSVLPSALIKNDPALGSYHFLYGKSVTHHTFFHHPATWFVVVMFLSPPQTFDFDANDRINERMNDFCFGIFAWCGLWRVCF